MCNCLTIQIPNVGCCIRPGNRVKLGKFKHEIWVVGYGWYTWGGNRPVCGWYLTSEITNEVKPLQMPDLDDIYRIDS